MGEEKQTKEKPKTDKQKKREEFFKKLREAGKKEA